MTARRTAALLALSGFALGNAAHAEGDACKALRAPVAAGVFVTAEVVERVPCTEDRSRPALRYDRAAGAPVATSPLRAGTYLGRLTVPEGTVAGAQDKLRLVVRSGPVTIERDVSAVQPVREGRPGFVRTAEGEVLTARFVSAEARP